MAGPGKRLFVKEEDTVPSRSELLRRIEALEAKLDGPKPMPGPVDGKAFKEGDLVRLYKVPFNGYEVKVGTIGVIRSITSGFNNENVLVEWGSRFNKGHDGFVMDGKLIRRKNAGFYVPLDCLDCA